MASGSDWNWKNSFFLRPEASRLGVRSFWVHWLRLTYSCGTFEAGHRQGTRGGRCNWPKTGASSSLQLRNWNQRGSLWLDFHEKLRLLTKRFHNFFGRLSFFNDREEVGFATFGLKLTTRSFDRRSWKQLRRPQQCHFVPQTSLTSPATTLTDGDDNAAVPKENLNRRRRGVGKRHFF